jgi:uncharacterized membrane protein YagU involved in acid resistance
MMSFQQDWKAVAWAGIIAGSVFLALEMFMVPVFGGGSPWGPPRMMAAIALGKGVLPPPATFDFGIVMAAMGLHLMLSVVYAAVFALAVSRLSFGPALALGAIGGMVLYVVNFYGFTALFPWFAMARNWISIVGHVVFGLVAAGAYVAISEHHIRVESLVRVTLREEKV